MVVGARLPAHRLRHVLGPDGVDAADADADGAPRAAQNPEQDSFVYLEMLLESLARLGKMGYALEMIGQRLPFEVHQLVDATIDEVDRRRVEEHLRSCAHCPALVQALLGLRAVLHSSTQAPELRASIARSLRRVDLG